MNECERASELHPASGPRVPGEPRRGGGRQDGELHPGDPWPRPGHWAGQRGDSAVTTSPRSEGFKWAIAFIDCDVEYNFLAWMGFLWYLSIILIKLNCLPFFMLKQVNLLFFTYYILIYSMIFTDGDGFSFIYYVLVLINKIYIQIVIKWTPLVFKFVLIFIKNKFICLLH